MKKSEIKFLIETDEENIPEKIIWDASQKPDEGPSEAKAISISLWDHIQKNTMRIDLWGKDMPVNEMKRFYVDAIGGFAQSILNATGDEHMASEINQLCDNLVKHITDEEEELRKNA